MKNKILKFIELLKESHEEDKLELNDVLLDLNDELIEYEVHEGYFSNKALEREQIGDKVFNILHNKPIYDDDKYCFCLEIKLNQLQDTKKLPNRFAGKNLIKDKKIFTIFREVHHISERYDNCYLYINASGITGIYGAQWRSCRTSYSTFFEEYNYIDQIQNLINDLKTNPDSRRLMVNAWNVGQIDEMVLPPCHYGFQVYTRELSEGERGLLLQPYGLDPLTKDGRDRLWEENNLPKRAISLMWNQRSIDTPLGLPFNIASYGLLLIILGKLTNMVPDELIGNLGDTHIYLNQVEGVKEQLTREPYKLPTLNISNSVNFKGAIDDMLASCTKDDFTLSNYISHSKIDFPLSN